MGMGFSPTWLRQVSPLLHKTTLTTGIIALSSSGRAKFLLYIFHRQTVRLYIPYADPSSHSVLC